MRERFGHLEFDNQGGLEAMLDLLGATPSEKEAVVDRMKQARADLLKLEESLAKPTITPEQVDIDLSAMEEPARHSIDQLKEDVGDLLPPPLGSAFTDAIKWDNFYFYNGTQKNVGFQIVRNAGGLSFIYKNGYTMTRGLTPEDFPNDGQPHPIGTLVDSRWRARLKDVSLLPSGSSDSD